MMPTFPRSPLSFRTAGFPRYGCKAGLSDGTFPAVAPLKSAPDIHIATTGLHPSFVHSAARAVIPVRVGAAGPIMHRHEVARSATTPGVLARVRVVLSRSVIT